ncbi:lipocalin family protein [uncultured Microscilla sp.]|uniref:lipocalin family protein n=1 Tax=uncultured Microscilla sp. TaxID=432653 RepID=UPI00263797F7|nr:lipocalin family protein [uncultured Microscilla sp.]
MIKHACDFFYTLTILLLMASCTSKTPDKNVLITKSWGLDMKATKKNADKDKVKEATGPLGELGNALLDLLIEEVDFTFRKDKTFNVTFLTLGKGEKTGKWSIEGNTLKLKILSEGIRKDTTSFNIIKLSENQLVLKENEKDAEKIYLKPKAKE